MSTKNKGSIRKWLELFIFAVAVIAVYKTFDDFSVITSTIGKILGVLSPFIYGGVIAFLLFLPAKKIEILLYKIKKPFFQKRARSISSIAALLLFLIILVVLLVIFLPSLYRNIYEFARSIPGYLNELYTFIKEHFGDEIQIDHLIQTVNQYLTPSKILDFLSMNDWSSYIAGIQSVIGTLTNIGLGMILAIYLLIDRANIRKNFNRVLQLIFKERRAERVNDLLIRIGSVLNSFIYGQALDALFVGVASGVGFQLLGVKNAPILGLIYGLFSLIPYFGALFGVITVSIFTFLSGGLGQLIIAFIFITVLQQIDGNIVNPKIIGNSIGIKPLYVIFGVTLFGGLFGVVGMFLGPPLMAIMIELIDDFIAEKEFQKKLKKWDEKESDMSDMDSSAEPYMEQLGKEDD
ncbi:MULTISPECIES: AI-2E family transporter [Clostridiaceae]|uniref:AI-2E family transporter n=1 Tax=Clostridium facile TaxID=2763035 RepID=A0ABR7IT23_9CLOT|nr:MULTISPECIES: AI-2E family transporter [Clostridiaceae]MBC5788288.1 AI-2E family transporter [Clostridium facile]